MGDHRYYALPDNNYKRPEIGEFIICIAARRLFAGTVVKDSCFIDGWAVKTPCGKLCSPWPNGIWMKPGCQIKNIKATVVIDDK